MLTRLPIVSSIHMRAPPAPQQKPFSRQRRISTCRDAGDGVEHAARLVEDPVVTAEVAGVVVGDGARVGDAGRESAGRDQMAQQLGVVDHLEVAAETPGTRSSSC